MTGPTAARGRFPYKHRTILEVDYDEAQAAWKERHRVIARESERVRRTRP